MPDKSIRARRDVLRIGFYTFFPGGGIGRYTHELLRAIGRRPDVDAELICSPGFEWKEAAEYHTWEGLYDVWTPKAYMRRAWFIRGQLLNPLRGVRRARNAQLDVLHLANINHLTFPIWKSALDRSRVLLGVSAHDVLRGKAMIHRGWEDRQLRSVYRRADAVFVHSDYQAEELISFADVSRSRVHVVPHGPYPHGEPTANRETVRAHLGLPQERQVALFFGQIRDEKNLDSLLEALASMTDRPHLLIAGKSWPGHKSVTYYDQLIARLGLTDSVTFLRSFIPEEQVPDLFVASDWAALPYRSAFTSQSGVLNVAAAYRRPVVVSNAPVLRETVEACDIGLACSGDAPSELAQGIAEMMKRVEIGHEHAFDDYLRLHSWDENARRTYEAYASLQMPGGEAVKESASDPAVRNRIRERSTAGDRSFR